MEVITPITPAASAPNQSASTSPITRAEVESAVVHIGSACWAWSKPRLASLWSVTQTVLLAIIVIVGVAIITIDVAAGVLYVFDRFQSLHRHVVPHEPTPVAPHVDPVKPAPPKGHCAVGCNCGKLDCRCGEHGICEGSTEPDANRKQ